MNSLQETQSVVAAVIQKVTGITTDIHMGTDLMGLDTFSFIEILIILEDIYEVEINDEEAAGFVNVGDLVRHIEYLGRDEGDEEEDAEGSQVVKKAIVLIHVLAFIGLVLYVTTSNGAIVFT